MIITNTSEANTKASNRAPESTNRAGTSDPPPAYGASSSAPAAAPAPASARDEQRQPLLANHSVHAPQSAGGRFFRAFAVAVFIWLLVSLLIQSIFGLAQWTSHRAPWTGDFPVPTGVQLSDCVTEDGWLNVITQQDQSLPPGSWFLYASRTQYELPLKSDTLFFLSRGATSGSSTIRVSDGVPNDVVRVGVTIKYRSWDVRDRGTKVCRIYRKDNSVGVGIFNRRRFDYNNFRYHTYYEIDVQVPPSAQIRNLETDLPNSSQRVDNLNERVNISSISLKSSNAPISFKSLLVKDGKIQSSNAPIQGIITATNSLQLKTSNAPIQVDVTLENDDISVAHLGMHTTNNKLESDVKLTSSNGKGGSYLVEASTSNGPLNVYLNEAPVDSTLRLLATTSNSPALVSLAPTYEGSVNLRSSSPFTPNLQAKKVQDPAGRGRNRIIHTQTSGGRLSGSVSWSGKPGPGSVTVQTSNSPVTLKL